MTTQETPTTITSKLKDEILQARAALTTHSSFRKEKLQIAKQNMNYGQLLTRGQALQEKLAELENKAIGIAPDAPYVETKSYTPQDFGDDGILQAIEEMAKHLKQQIKADQTNGDIVYSTNEGAAYKPTIADMFDFLWRNLSDVNKKKLKGKFPTGAKALATRKINFTKF